nr:hypothetical protein [uncultured Bacteroides sp.]
MMKYCKETTEQHPLSIKYPACLEQLKGCIKKEGGSGELFSDDDICLNLDEVEEKVSKGGDREATMDVAIGLSEEKRNRQMLLVEFRFRYDKPSNIGKKEIEDKINHSKQLLLGGGTINKDYVFVFSPKKVNEARSHFRRLFSGKKVSALVMEEKELHNTYF